MQKKLLLVMLLVACVALSGCALVVKDAERDKANEGNEHDNADNGRHGTALRANGRGVVRAECLVPLRMSRSGRMRGVRRIRNVPTTGHG